MDECGRVWAFVHKTSSGPRAALCDSPIVRPCAAATALATPRKAQTTGPLCRFLSPFWPSRCHLRRGPLEGCEVQAIPLAEIGDSVIIALDFRASMAISQIA